MYVAVLLLHRYRPVFNGMYPARSVIGMATTTETKTRYLIDVTYCGRQFYIPFAAATEEVNHDRLARLHLITRCGVEPDGIQRLVLLYPEEVDHFRDESTGRRRRFIERLVRWVHA